MRASLTYFSVIVITLCCLALTPSSVRAQRDQIGASPQQASPEIVAQMKQESRRSFSAAEIREFKLLHDADATATRATEEIRRRVLAISNQFSELDSFISGLDTTVDTRRLLMRNTSDIAEIQRVQSVLAKDGEKRDERQWMILVSTLMLMVGAVVRFVFDDRRRAAAIADNAKQAEARNAAMISQVIAHIDEAAESRSNQRHKALGMS